MKKLSLLLAVFMTFGVTTAFAQCSPTGPCPDGDFPPAFYEMIKRAIFGSQVSNKQVTASPKKESTKTSGTTTAKSAAKTDKKPQQTSKTSQNNKKNQKDKKDTKNTKKK